MLAAREELIIDRTVARRFISVEALAWSMDPAEAAEELWVDRPALEMRLACLHPVERAYLERRLVHHD